jgi:hypothetical protein
VALAPGRGVSGTPPAGDRHLVVQDAQSGEADELARGADFHRPEAEAAAVQVVLEVQRPRLGLPGRQQRAEVPPDLRVGVHRRPRREIGFPPAAHDQSLGADLHHRDSLLRSGSMAVVRVFSR